MSTALLLTSSDFVEGATLPLCSVHSSVGADALNLSPQLGWSGIPEDTKSFALTAYDPDAPTGSGWWHWVVYDLPTATRSLSRGAGVADGSLLPVGAKQGRTDFGAVGYGGAAPPPGHGLHRYIFTLHALSVAKIEAPENATAAAIGFRLHKASLSIAKLTATFGR